MGSFLTVKEAAARLNVHVATIRRWADDGSLASVRTPGGHRRFPVEAVERMVSGKTGESGHGGPQRDEAERGATERGAHLPAQRESHSIEVTSDSLSGHHDEPWMRRLTDAGREESRLLGKRLMGLLMQYMAFTGSEGEEVLEEARVIGRIYAKSIIVNGISLPQALKATMFFKDHILESAVMLPEAARQNPDANKRVFRRINEFLNAIQLVIAETYERVDSRHPSESPKTQQNSG
jgi:excisionase family DNA binding protein